MKTLVIEKVSNGWIVRPFSPGFADWARGDQVEMFVYLTVDDIAKDLPKLLNDQKVTNNFDAA